MGFFDRFRPGSGKPVQADAPPSVPFDLDQPLVSFSPHDPWRIRDACEGTQIFGMTGSGKTSGSGAALAGAFLAAGFGGLVLTAKPDECRLWQRYAAKCGRSHDLIVFGADQPWRFNFLDYEMRRPGPGGGETENIVRLFHTVLEIAEGGGRHRASDPFWERAVKQMLRNAIDVLKAAGRGLQLGELYEVIRTAPTSVAEASSPDWQARSLCFRCIMEGDARVAGTPAEHDFLQASKYWLWEFPALADNTRSSIVTTFTSMADCFLRGRLRDLFCTGTNVIPEMTHLGRIVVLDLPVKQWAEIGRFAQILFKHVWQQAAERRDTAANPRPAFLWADEAQFFVTPHDALFQSTARSARVATVYLTQNLPSYHAMLGDSKAETDALLGNLATKIFHANGDAATNQWAAETIAKSWQGRTSTGYTHGEKQGAHSHNVGRSESLEYDIQPQEFTRLRKGGPDHGGVVDGIVFQGGRTWAGTGKNAIKVSFRQGNSA